MKKAIIIFSVFLIILFVGCTTPQPPAATGLMSFKALDDSKSTSRGVNQLVLANNKFAIDYYNIIDKEENLFFSPFSISTALAMTYEGADGKTGEEMRNVFYFPEDDTTRQSSFAKIYNTLNDSASKGNYQFSIANSLWAEQTYKFHQSF